MYYFPKKKIFCLLLTICFLLVGCKNIPQGTSDFSASDSTDAQPLPNTSIPNAVPSETEDSEQTPPISPPSNVWDVSAIDTEYIQPQRKLIAFTFDDSPSRYSENLLSVFASYNEHNPDCKATASLFFNGGKFDADTPHLLYTACTLGLELGNHTHSHANLTTLDEETLRREIEQTDALLQKADGISHHLFRAPYGKINELVKTVVATPIIDWTIDTLDWSGVSEDSIYRTVLDNKFPGAIVLMHDGYPHTVDALKRLLPDLKAEGYQVVSVSAMAKAHGCVLKRGNVYIRARKIEK